MTNLTLSALIALSVKKEKVQKSNFDAALLNLGIHSKLKKGKKKVK